MNFPPISISVFMTAGFVAVSLALWLIVRKIKDAKIIPTLLVLKLPLSKKPKTTFKLPPLIPFFCFLIMICTFFVFNLQPFQKFIYPSDKTNNTALIVVDLSPSIQACKNIDDYKEFVFKKSSALLGEFAISILLSNEVTPREIKSSSDLKKIVNDLNYHRSGFRLVSLLEVLGDKLNDYSEMYFFSDYDEYSWEGLNWDFLSQKINFNHIDVSGDEQDTYNMYFENIELLENSSDKIVSWRINLARTNSSSREDVEIGAWLDENKIAKAMAEFEAGVPPHLLFST